MAKAKYAYGAPRWAGVSGFVKQLALYTNVEYRIESQKGFIMETGVVVCEGSDENIMEFNEKFKSAMQDYNFK